MTIILAEPTAEDKPDTGIWYDVSINEYRVIIDGVTVNFATHESTAYHQFTEAYRIRREHLQSNPMETN